MKLFLVKSSCGEHDSFYSWTAGVFESEELAATAIDKIAAKYDADKNRPFPLQGYNNPDNVPKDTSKEIWDEIWEWHDLREKALDFNGSIIEEIILNEIVKY